VLDHLTLRAADRDESGRFYRTVLSVLGYEPGVDVPDFVEWEDFGVARAGGDRPVTTGLHIGFVARSRKLVDAFWEAGVGAGYTSDGEPGERPRYTPDYYGAFLLDPDGNSAEAVHHRGMRTDGVIDHLWIRVSDLDASRAFYSTIGFPDEHPADDPPRMFYGTGNGSVSFVDDGEPARNVHIAFPASSNADVDAFHARMIAAGYRDNGPPGERSEYHPGYYGAFVLDPDGNNVELVCHNR
jgi:catechol 2,3-dioxygenase-like lactoylglutathione lyase family enzyme